MADKMAQGGYKDAGYMYVSIDDCWASKERDSNGKLQPDPKRFPSGMAALADYVSSLSTDTETRTQALESLYYSYLLYAMLTCYV